MQLVSFENSFLERFLINVDAEAVEAIFAIVITDHLSCERSLFLLRVVYDPDASDVDLLCKVGTVLDGHQFFDISDSEIVFEF